MTAIRQLIPRPQAGVEWKGSEMIDPALLIGGFLFLICTFFMFAR